MMMIKYELPNSDWGERKLARILSHMRQKVKVGLLHNSNLWTLGEVQALAQAIRGHPTITSFDSGYNLPYESMDSLYSALATLPALESVKLSTPPEEETTLAYPESLRGLFLVPSLRFVRFSVFSFTRALWQATANALMEGTAITNLEFTKCSFSAGEYAAIMATGLSRNTSVISIAVQCLSARALFDALTAALPSNSTLQHLDLCWQNNHDNPDLSPVFLAMGKNAGVKTLNLSGAIGSMCDSLSIAMKVGLGMNDTLESLVFKSIFLCDENFAMWCRALSFLCTNKALKSLTVTVEYGIHSTESCFSAFHTDIVAMLQENTSLEILSISGWQNAKARIISHSSPRSITIRRSNTSI
jgi:hypothetical protein